MDTTPPGKGAALSDAVIAAITDTISNHADIVQAWRQGTPKTWGYLAGRTVGATRRLAQRDLTDAERRLVWAALWERLHQTTPSGTARE